MTSLVQCAVIAQGSRPIDRTTQCTASTRRTDCYLEMLSCISKQELDGSHRSLERLPRSPGADQSFCVTAIHDERLPRAPARPFQYGYGSIVYLY